MNKTEAIKALEESSWEYENRYFRYELAVNLEDAKEIVAQIEESQKDKGADMCAMCERGRVMTKDIELMSFSEHSRYHAKERWKERGGFVAI